MQASSQQDFLDKLSKRLIDLRKENDLTQAKLAQETKLDRTALANIENGRRRPTITTLYKISVALNMKIEDIFKGM